VPNGTRRRRACGHRQNPRPKTKTKPTGWTVSRGHATTKLSGKPAFWQLQLTRLCWCFWQVVAAWASGFLDDGLTLRGNLGSLDTSSDGHRQLHTRRSATQPFKARCRHPPAPTSRGTDTTVAALAPRRARLKAARVLMRRLPPQTFARLK